MDELDRRIVDLVQPLNRQIKDGFSVRVMARIGRRELVRHVVLLIAASFGLAISAVPIAQLLVSVTDRLIGAPAQIPDMTDSFGILFAGIFCVGMLFLIAVLRRLERRTLHKLLAD